jgi:hypothetical protein
LEERSRLLEERARLLEERARLLEERNRLLEERARLLGAHTRLLGERTRLLGERTRLLEERIRLQGERTRLLGESVRLLGERTRLLEERAWFLRLRNFALRRKNILDTKELSMTDYIPHKDAEFDTWFSFMYRYVSQKCAGSPPAWPYIPQAALGSLAELHAAWKTAYSAVIGPHTKVDTEAKNNAKKAAMEGIRPFVNQYLRFPPVTDEDRTAMGIRNPDRHPTPQKPPETGPAFSVVQSGPRMLGIVYRFGEKGKKGSKPPGVQGARIYYGVFDTAPALQDELPASVWATRCPHVIMFRETDRGRRAYFALKWEVRKEHGESNWSEIQSELIP